MEGLKSYIGQSRIKKLLLPEIEAAKRKGMPLPHTLLYGPPGLGKSRLAHAISEEMGQIVKEYPAPKNLTMKEAQRFLLGLPALRYHHEPAKAGIPMQGAEVYLIFLDEVHLLPSFEAWFEALENGHLTINGSPSWLPYFSLVAATTEIDELPRAFTRRFSLDYMLELYTVDELADIIRGRFPNFKDAQEVAERSRGSAAFAIKYVERVENFGGVDWFSVAGIDARGMTDLDRRYIEILRTSAGPVSLGSLAARLQQDASTIRHAVEPFLLSEGILEVTERGRRLVEPGRGKRVEGPENMVEKVLRIG